MKTLLKKLVPFVLLFSGMQAFSQAPVADFETCTRTIELWEVFTLTDLSTNNPTGWTWEVYDSNNYYFGPYVADINSGDVLPDPYANGQNEFTQNPDFMFGYPGLYTIVLTATNANGNSVERKKMYVNVIEATQYYPGYGTYGPPYWDNHVRTDYGTIRDNGGPWLNYTNNQGIASTSFLKITPDNGQNLTLKFSWVKIGLNDTFYVYDDDTINPSKLLGALTSADNGTYPVFNSTSPKMFVYFYSDSSGTDSGYTAEFYTSSGGPNNPNLIFDHTPVSVNQPTYFVNQFTSVLRGNYDLDWYVDDTLQAGFTNKDSFVYTINDSSTYEVCLKAHRCAGIDLSYCHDVNISNLSSFTTGINKKTTPVAYTVYPNPFTDRLTITNSSDLNLSGIKVFNLYGQVMEYTLEQENSYYQLRFGDDIKPGIYMIRLLSNDGGESYHKLVKQ